MTEAPTLLLIDSSDSDRALATFLLKRELPDAVIIPAPDALAAANALLQGMPDVAIVADDLAWANIRELVGTIKRRNPSTAIILFGHELDFASQALDPGLACQGLVRKTSAGFLALPGIVREVLPRTHSRVDAPRDPEPQTPSAPPRAGGGNPDLRDIALVFSHDFREPVQQIARSARRAEAADTAEGRAAGLRQVLESADRATSMLDGMIEYLTLTGRDAPLTAVDLNKALNQAIENLSASIDESHAEIRAAPLPVLLGDEQQIVHLFQNLLSNAIKFTRERPVVSISCERRDDKWLLAFRDNGIGIPSAFIDRIFELGKRLHTREEYPGTGIGLALCRRIVERHGGRIWAESGGGGSTFYVLVPRHPGEASHAAERETAVNRPRS
jgi:signal transduction histidine kinase